ncbi:MAG TPA: hypothetical protein VF960_02340 [Chloroflexota bacterium]
MIVALLVVTFMVALAVATLVMLLFRHPIDAIMARLIRDNLGLAWGRYMRFAIYVVGIGGGVNPGNFEKYLGAFGPGGQPAQLTSDRWVLEIYHTVMGTLQSTAWLLLVFFVFALIALVIVRGLESRHPRAAGDEGDNSALGTS